MCYSNNKQTDPGADFPAPDCIGSVPSLTGTPNARIHITPFPHPTQKRANRKHSGAVIILTAAGCFLRFRCFVKYQRRQLSKTDKFMHLYIFVLQND